jgi:hypothetical protein
MTADCVSVGLAENTPAASHYTSIDSISGPNKGPSPIKNSKSYLGLASYAVHLANPSDLTVRARCHALCVSVCRAIEKRAGLWSTSCRCCAVNQHASVQTRQTRLPWQVRILKLETGTTLLVAALPACQTQHKICHMTTGGSWCKQHLQVRSPTRYNILHGVDC